MIKPGTILYWTEDTPDAPDKAREFCRIAGLTGDDVKIVRRTRADEKMIMVEVKRPCKVKVKF